MAMPHETPGITRSTFIFLKVLVNNPGTFHQSLKDENIKGRSMYPGSAIGFFIIALLFGAVLGTLIGSLIGAVCLRAAAKSLENLNFTFGFAYITVLSAFLLSFAIFYMTWPALVTVLAAVSLVLGLSGDLSLLGLILLLIFLVAGFLVQAGMISIMHNLAFPKGLKLAGFAVFPSLLVAGLMVFLALLIFGAFATHTQTSNSPNHGADEMTTDEVIEFEKQVTKRMEEILLSRPESP
jgi:hypothetical protein